MNDTFNKISLSNCVCLIVEDQPAAMESIKSSLKKNFPQMEIITLTSIRETHEWLSQRSLQSKKLGLALIDLGLPDGSGIEIIKQLSKKDPECQKVVTTVHSDDAHLFDALSAGANGYILKDQDHDHFIDILKRLEQSEPPLSPAIAHRLLSHFRSAGIISDSPKDLTPRETETLTLIARGLTVQESAEKMGLSAQTVAGYVKNIYQKLHISSRAEATREAIRRGLT